MSTFLNLPDCHIQQQQQPLGRIEGLEKLQRYETRSVHSGNGSVVMHKVVAGAGREDVSLYLAQGRETLVRETMLFRG